MSDEEINRELLLVLFGYRHSNTVSQKVLTNCEVCERKLDDEIFFDTQFDQLVREQEPIINAIKEVFITTHKSKDVEE